MTRPEGHSWQSFAELLLDSMPGPTAEHYRNKIAVFLRWWWHRGFEEGIPDEADPGLEAARKIPSWRRICKALLRNDYWCKGLSFSQQNGKESSYARYKAIMQKRRDRWGSESGPGVQWERLCDHSASGMDRRLAQYGISLRDAPTPKQLALIASLTGGSSPAHAYEAIGRVMGCGKGAAKRKATRADAAKTINELKAADSEFLAEKRKHTPRDARGKRRHGLMEGGK